MIESIISIYANKKYGVKNELDILDQNCVEKYIRPTKENFYQSRLIMVRLFVTTAYAVGTMSEDCLFASLFSTILRHTQQYVTQSYASHSILSPRLINSQKFKNRHTVNIVLLQF